MADVAIWQDKKARAAFEARGKECLDDLKATLAGQTGVVAIEPESGDHFVGATLGKANAAAFAKYPDVWVYFARLDNLEAAMPMPTW
jgi:hypothetical protein